MTALHAATDTFHRRRRPRGADRRGAMLALIALLLPVVLLFMGFAVDLAYMQTTRMELRAAADAAARAGATALSQTGDEAAARRVASQIAQRNEVAGQAMLLRDSDIEIGRSTLQSSGKWAFTPGRSPSNAVRVTAPRNASSRGGSVSLFFGGLIGRKSFDPVMQATASFLSCDICVVLDRSTSMKLNVTGQTGGMYTSDPRFCAPPVATSRWIALDAAMQVFTDELRQSGGEHQVALASYSSDIVSLYGHLCGASKTPATLDARLSTNLKAIDDAVGKLSTGIWNGNTHIEAGMRVGLDALLDKRYARTTATKIMIVMTDGNENVGSAMAAARTAAAENVVVHTITFSDDVNQSLMKNVAAVGGGTHYHANTAEQLRAIFKEMAATVAGLTQ
ncbi:MAG: VWA domain-containing protein [Pirellulales bacterium]|nr:VWA domain-containing protein [Pirellulales bacterium]